MYQSEFCRWPNQKNSNNSWFRLHCSNNIFSFTNIAKKKKKKKNKKRKKLQSVFSNEEYRVNDIIDNSTKTCPVLKPQENVSNLFNE